MRVQRRHFEDEGEEHRKMEEEQSQVICVMRALIDAGADVNAAVRVITSSSIAASVPPWRPKLKLRASRWQDLHGWTPLHALTICGHSTAVRFVLSVDADVDARNDRYHTPHHNDAHMLWSPIVKSCTLTH
jgi:ankyrin repeat protein